MSRPHFRRVRTQAERRDRAQREAAGGDPVLGYQEKRRREWAIRVLVQKRGAVCALCGEHMNRVRADAREMTIDHIVPIAAGGTDAITNLQLACRACNEAKGCEVRP